MSSEFGSARGPGPFWSPRSASRPMLPSDICATCDEWYAGILSKVEIKLTISKVEILLFFRLNLKRHHNSSRHKKNNYGY